MRLPFKYNVIFSSTDIANSIGLPHVSSFPHSYYSKHEIVVVDVVAYAHNQTQSTSTSTPLLHTISPRVSAACLNCKCGAPLNDIKPDFVIMSLPLLLCIPICVSLSHSLSLCFYSPSGCVCQN